MGGELEDFNATDRWSPYAEEEGTLLDLAVRNRAELWESVRARHGCTVERKLSDSDWYGGEVCFVHEGQKYLAPGKFARSSDWQMYAPKWDYDAPRTGADGPDGKGEDRLIKNAAQFKESFTEIVEQLSSLRSFRWTSYVTPMPAGVCAALGKIQTLASLDITLSTERSNVWDLPLWDISSKPVKLCLPVIENGGGFKVYHDVPEQSEDEVNAVEAPLSSPIVDKKAREKYHAAVASRTIVAAARGGNLRHIYSDDEMEKPFAIRALLPFWVQLESMNGRELEWLAATKALRLLLAHTSYLLELREIRDNRLLTLQDVQSLLSSFRNDKGLPKVTRARRCDFRYVYRYLTWLSEDAELAQQVADAWNKLVQRGEADVIKCACDDCPAEAPSDEEWKHEEESQGSWDGESDLD